MDFKKTKQLTKAILNWIKILKVKVKFMFKVIKCRINFEISKNLDFHIYIYIYNNIWMDK